MSTPGDRSSAASLERLAAELPRLGAESRGERTAKQWLPWVFSVAVHLGVAVIAVFITWTVSNRPADESVVIVADFNAMLYDPVVAMEMPQQTEVTPAAPVVAATPTALPDARQLLDEWESMEDRGLSQLADIANSAAADSAPRGALAGLVPASDPTAASFAGTSATNARRIVYLIDATGSMIAHLQIVLDELARSLSNLSSQQSYTVIFFQGDRAIEVPPGGKLIAAAPAEHERVLTWIKQNIVPKDRTNPMPAIRLALKYRPDVVFLLSHGLTGHGEFEIDQRDLLTLLDQENPADRGTGRRITQINCIQFLAEDPLDTMKRIAEAHGGPTGYKFLSRRELGLGNN